MKKSEMIQRLSVNIEYCEEQLGYYEKLHGEHMLQDGLPHEHSIWSEMCDWYRGRFQAYNIALDMAKKLDC